jgi:hypothetical protein
MMSDPAVVAGKGPAGGARAAAARLAPEFGDRLPADVEAALHTPAGGGGDRYLDPVALAALIVSAAQLAWTVYADLQKRTAKPAPQVVARRVRVELAEHTEIDPGVRDRVIDIVVAETLSPGHE